MSRGCRRPRGRREELAKRTPRKPAPDWVWAKETLLLICADRDATHAEVEVQAIQAGPVVCIRIHPNTSCNTGST